jgi:hypothetical protein
MGEGELEGELELCLPSPKDGRGAGGEGKDLSLHWDSPAKIHPYPNIFDALITNYLRSIL